MYPLRVIHDLRPALPWTVVALPITFEQTTESAVLERRFAIKWDEDNDERIFAALLDVFYRRPEAIWNLYAVAEHKGTLSIWAANFPAADMSSWLLASKGPAIQDDWPVTSVQAYGKILRTGGRRLPDAIAEDAVLRTFPPEDDELNWLINLFDLGPSGAPRDW